MIPRVVLLFLPLLLLVVASAAGAGGHYLPRANDRFDYSETVVLTGISGNYSTYSETTDVTGTVGVTAVASNGTDSASYSNSASWSDNNGSAYSWTSAGNFTFSAETFLYAHGTDNQTGYTNPSVWFYINDSLTQDDSFTLLNTVMNVASTQAVYDFGSGSEGSVKAILTEGNGTFQRNDIYGVFTAAYSWSAFYDPSTGYIVGYVYTEQDTDNAGDAFDISDTLFVTSTTYPLTPSSPPPTTSSGGGLSTPLVLALILLVVVVVIVVVALALARSRRRAALPKHSARGDFGYGPPPGISPMGVPPPVHLTPSGQPAVQQIVLRETVKVNCRYCGTLIDTTDTVCPNCGAPRT